jgi:xanthine dehydrogenase YagS FAD-binding subunit
MRSFNYTRAANEQEALNAVGKMPESVYLGGGTNLLDLMKMGVARPAQLVDICRVPLNRIEEREGGVRIGAMVRNSEAADHPLIRQR